MRLYFGVALVWVPLLALPSPAAPASVPPGLAAKALLRQARQYAAIKTISFSAFVHHAVTVPGRGTKIFKDRYEYWGAGVKYRVDYQQFIPGAEDDVVVTDNGMHYRCLDRLAGVLRIGPSHPVHGAPPVIQNPILEPLMPLAPYFSKHLGTPHLLWMGFPRFARNPRSIFDRCLQVTDLRQPVPGIGLQGYILGSDDNTPARVTFDLGPRGASRPLVTGWVAREFRYPGSYDRLGQIRYRKFRLASGRNISLPVAYSLTGVVKNMPVPAAASGPIADRVVVTGIVIDHPIPASRFTIDYKLARLVVQKNPDGNFHYIHVQPVRPVPGRDWKLKTSTPPSH